jgi:hypothetical protein
VESRFRNVSCRLVEESPVAVVDVLLAELAEPVAAFALVAAIGPVIAGVNPCIFMNRSSPDFFPKP